MLSCSVPVIFLLVAVDNFSSAGALRFHAATSSCSMAGSAPVAATATAGVTDPYKVITCPDNHPLTDWGAHRNLFNCPPKCEICKNSLFSWCPFVRSGTHRDVDTGEKKNVVVKSCRECQVQYNVCPECYDRMIAHRYYGGCLGRDQVHVLEGYMDFAIDESESDSVYSDASEVDSRTISRSKGIDKRVLLGETTRTAEEVRAARTHKREFSSIESLISAGSDMPESPVSQKLLALSNQFRILHVLMQQVNDVPQWAWSRGFKYAYAEHTACTVSKKIIQFLKRRGYVFEEEDSEDEQQLRDNLWKRHVYVSATDKTTGGRLQTCIGGAGDLHALGEQDFPVYVDYRVKFATEPVKTSYLGCPTRPGEDVGTWRKEWFREFFWTVFCNDPESDKFPDGGSTGPGSCTVVAHERTMQQRLSNVRKYLIYTIEVFKVLTLVILFKRTQFFDVFFENATDVENLEPVEGLSSFGKADAPSGEVS